MSDERDAVCKICLLSAVYKNASPISVFHMGRGFYSSGFELIIPGSKTYFCSPSFEASKTFYYLVRELFGIWLLRVLTSLVFAVMVLKIIHGRVVIPSIISRKIEVVTRYRRVVLCVFFYVCFACVIFVGKFGVVWLSYSLSECKSFWSSKFSKKKKKIRQQIVRVGYASLLLELSCFISVGVVSIFPNYVCW